MRRFSDNRKSVGMAILKPAKIIENASIKNIAGQEDLYGNNGEIENMLSQLEGQWSTVLRMIDASRKVPGFDDARILLLLFMLLSDARTQSVATDQNALITETSKSILRIYNRVGKTQFSKDVIDAVQVGYKIPNLVPIRQAFELIAYLVDLHLILIVNETHIQFITSDSPFVRYNKLLALHHYAGGYGLAHIGFMCYIPISPVICLCAYDRDVYTPNIDEDDRLIIKAPDQIILLNALFACNADNALFYNNSEKDWRIERYISNIPRTKEEHTFIYNEIGGRLGQLVRTQARSVHKLFDIKAFPLAPKYVRYKLTERVPFRPFIEHVEKELKKQKRTVTNNTHQE